MNTTVAEKGFQAGMSAGEADRALKSAVRTMDAAKHRAVLWFADIMNRRLYRMLGYSSMMQYARVELKFSRTRAGDFLRLARKLGQLPAVEKSLASGDLGYTNVLEIIKVATPVTQDKWVAEAAQSTRRTLATKVKRVRAKARRRKSERGQGCLIPENPDEIQLASEVPLRVGLEFTPEQFARFEALVEKVKRIRAVPSRSSREEALLAGLEALVEGTSGSPNDCREISSSESARRRVFPPPFQVHIHKCPECGKSTVRTSRGEREISPADSARAECDARHRQPGKRNTATIPPGRRMAVLARDRFRCRAPGCGNSRFLEVHHLKPRSHGGGNRANNLITLCAGCHRLHHEGRLRI